MLLSHGVDIAVTTKENREASGDELLDGGQEIGPARQAKRRITSSTSKPG